MIRQEQSRHQRAHSRRTVLHGAAAAIAGIGQLRTGLAQEATPSSGATPTAPKGLTVGVDYFPSPAPGVPAAYLRPPEPFPSVETVPGSGGTVTTLQITFAPPLPPRDENQYWQELERRLNVTFEPNIAPSSTYGESVAVATASGDLPDLMLLRLEGETSSGKLIQQGAFTDLTDYLTGDALQDYPNLALFSDELWRQVAVNGRVYTVPRAFEGMSSPLLFREDWVGQVGAQLPKNAQEFRDLLMAFVQNDPDKNGSTDTWGLGSNGGSFNLSFFNSIFRVPNGWRLNADGTLTSALETEEYRQAVAYARELWAAGVYHPDSATMTSSQANDALVAGDIGGFVGGITGLPALRTRTTELNPEANVIGLVPFGHDGGVGVAYKLPGFYGATAIPIGRDDARVRELLRILNYFAAPFGSEEFTFLRYGIEGVHYTVEPDGTQLRTELGEAEVRDLFETARPLPVFYYPNFPPELHQAQYQQGLLRDLLAIGIDDPTWGLYSSTAEEEGGQLGQFVNDQISSIIQGRDSLDTLNQMVEDWRSRGGDQIRQEYEEALAAQ